VQAGQIRATFDTSIGREISTIPPFCPSPLGLTCFYKYSILQPKFLFLLVVLFFVFLPFLFLSLPNNILTVSPFFNFIYMLLFFNI